MKPILYIAGLKDHRFKDLFQALVDNEIDLLIDIRYHQGNEHPDETMRMLNMVNGHNIEYQWLKQFANPFIIKEDPHEFHSYYEDYLMGMDKELDELYSLISSHRCCVIGDESGAELSQNIVLAETLKKKYGIEYEQIAVSGSISTKIE